MGQRNEWVPAVEYRCEGRSREQVITLEIQKEDAVIRGWRKNSIPELFVGTQIG